MEFVRPKRPFDPIIHLKTGDDKLDRLLIDIHSSIDTYYDKNSASEIIDLVEEYVQYRLAKKEACISKLETENKEILRKLKEWNDIVNDHNSQFNKIGDKFMDFYKSHSNENL